VAAVRPVRRLIVCAGFSRLPRARRAQVQAIAGLVRLAPRRALGVGLSGREVSRLMRAAARFEVGEVTAPTLVLWGERDRVNAALGRTLAAELPDATAQEIPAAGHVANLDNPGAFTAAVAGFLGTRAPPTV
jgi:pimeloyl-ACP methyl ester carboxylesterase